ncbi:MAG: helix-turn-helix domain-containing protein [Alphaproteobacteria bacterium]|nr:helix-turn-helix domain-containing protein [Alphaproteobacteria bacterium]
MKKEIEGFLGLLRELQKIDPEFPLQYAICLAEVTLNEGLSVTELSNRTGLALSTVSRIVGALSKYRQMGKPYELIDLKTSETSRRTKEIYLTKKGKRIVGNIAGLMAA